LAVARIWLSIRVELVSGRGRTSGPGRVRIFAAARSRSLAQPAEAVDLAFARWDLSHLYMFTLANGTNITALQHWDGVAPTGSLDSRTTRLSRLKAGEQFAYAFDMGDDWAHLCTVGADRIDPSTNLASSRTDRCPTGVGETCQTSKAAVGRATTASLPNRNGQLACSAIFRRSCPGGGRGAGRSRSGHRHVACCRWPPVRLISRSREINYCHRRSRRLPAGDLHMGTAVLASGW
jgi:Plasmid pRiA4b ORF-3-like protein